MSCPHIDHEFTVDGRGKARTNIPVLREVAFKCFRYRGKSIVAITVNLDSVLLITAVYWGATSARPETLKHQPAKINPFRSLSCLRLVVDRLGW